MTLADTYPPPLTSFPAPALIRAFLPTPLKSDASLQGHGQYQNQDIPEKELPE